MAKMKNIAVSPLVQAVHLFSLQYVPFPSLSPAITNLLSYSTTFTKNQIASCGPMHSLLYRTMWLWFVGSWPTVHIIPHDMMDSPSSRKRVLALPLLHENLFILRVLQNQ